MTPFDAAWLAASVRLATPLALAASGELVAERTGVINVGLEGMMLMGAFFGFYVTSVTGSLFVGILGAIGAGMALAALMALLALRLRADQIVLGIGLNILALGITSSLFDSQFVGQATLNVGKLERVAVPLLSQIPILGRVLFDQSVLVYALYVVIALVWFLLNRTTWGLEMRATGETPEAVDAAGISVNGRRALGTLIAGGLAGLGGAFLSIAQLGLFVKGMSGGRGFLALAAVIFGMWRPAGVLAACLVFGAADAMQLRLQAEPTVPNGVWLVMSLTLVAFLAYRVVRSGWSSMTAPGAVVLSVLVAVGITLTLIEPAWRFPGSLWLAAPYALALVTLAVVRGRSNAPAKLGVPYFRAGGAA